MKNKDLALVIKDLRALKHYTGAELALKRIRMLKKINAHVETIKEAVEHKEYENYLKEVGEINFKYCHKDKAEQPILIDIPGGQKYDFTEEDFKRRKKELDKLEKKYADVIEVQKKKDKDYEELMKKECDLELEKLPFALFEKIEDLKGEDIENLLFYDLIDDSNAE